MPATIKVGSTGPDVVVWQRVLGVAVDGVFGPKTDAATRAWQRAHGLVVDGVVGSATWAAAGVPGVEVEPLGRVEPAPYHARILDSYPFSMGGSPSQAKALRTGPRPAEGMALYVGVASRETCLAVIEAGMGLVTVTRAGEYNDGSADEIDWLRKVGYPRGASVALDFEGLPAYEEGKADPAALGLLLDAWADQINAAGWDPILYVGSPQPFTSEELSARRFHGFWKGVGAVTDRFGKPAYPRSGYVLHQAWHNTGDGYVWPGSGGVKVDANSAEVDHWGRTLSWVVKA